MILEKGLLIFIYTFYLWSLAPAAPLKSEKMLIVCNTVFFLKGRRAYRLDSFTNSRVPVKDGVYQTKSPWCLYSVIDGVPIEKDSDEIVSSGD